MLTDFGSGCMLKSTMKIVDLLILPYCFDNFCFVYRKQGCNDEGYDCHIFLGKYFFNHITLNSTISDIINSSFPFG